jgi:hypothetical protein
MQLCHLSVPTKIAQTDQQTNYFHQKIGSLDASHSPLSVHLLATVHTHHSFSFLHHVYSPPPPSSQLPHILGRLLSTSPCDSVLFKFYNLTPRSWRTDYGSSSVFFCTAAPPRLWPISMFQQDFMALQCRHILQILSTSHRYVMSPRWCKAKTTWCANLPTSSQGSCEFIVNHIRRFAWTIYALADSQRPSNTTSFHCWVFLNYFWIFQDMISVIFLEYHPMGHAGFLRSLLLPLFFNWLPLVLLGASLKSRYVVLIIITYIKAEPIC